MNLKYDILLPLKEGTQNCVYSSKLKGLLLFFICNIVKQSQM